MKRSQRLLMVGLSVLFSLSLDARGQTFTISNLSLGMPESQALGIVSQGFTIRRFPFSNLPNMLLVTAQKNTPNMQSFYKFNFVDGKLEAFSVATDWHVAPQPLAKNIHDSLVQKLGPPTNGGDTSRFVPGISHWIFDNQGHILPDGTSLTQSCTGPETGFPGDANIQKVDAKCGVSIELHINQSSGYASSTVVYVINRPTYNAISDQLSVQAKAAKQQQNNKANQIKSPY